MVVIGEKRDDMGGIRSRKEIEKEVRLDEWIDLGGGRQKREGGWNERRKGFREGRNRK